MDKTVYHHERRKLVHQYPIYMTDAFLRNSRLVFAIILVIGVKVGQAGLVSLKAFL